MGTYRSISELRETPRKLSTTRDEFRGGLVHHLG